MKTKNAFCALGGLLLACLGAAASAAPFAYISRADGQVAVADVATQQLAGMIGTGGRPEGVAMSFRDRRGYIANGILDVVHVVDLAARAVVANIPVAAGPSAVLLNPPENRLYILHPGTGAFSQVSIIDTDSRSGAGTIVFADRADRMTMTPDGTRLFFSHPVANVVSVVSLNSHTVVGRIATGAAPYGMAYDPGLDRLYIANSGSNSVSIINATAITPIATIALPTCQNPRNLALNAGGTHLFVSCEDNNAVVAIELATLTMATASVGMRPTAIEVTPDGNFVWVANSGSGIVSILAAANIGSLRGQVNGGGILSGFDKFIGGPAEVAPTPPGVLSGLWWKPDESGWGIHLTQRQNNVFAAWFTYDPVGAPRWYVASNCAFSPVLACPTCVDNASCSGQLYEANGARFFREPFNPASVQLTAVGTLRLDFQGANSATMSYVVGSRARTLPIQRQVFQVGSTPPSVNYTDLWWNPNESGWGLGITQQFGVMFLAWFVYEDTSRPIWYVASSCTVKGPGNGCAGTLYRTAGPPGPGASDSFDPSQVHVSAVGTIDVSFTDPNNGFITYTVEGVYGTKAITRQLF